MKTKTGEIICLRAKPLPKDERRVRDLVAGAGVFSLSEAKIAADLVRERLHNGLSSGYRFLFCDWGRTTVAYACYGHIACTAASYDLYWIATAPQWRGKGLAKSLLSQVERKVCALGGTRVYVDTSSRPEYAAAHALYENSGYTLATELQDYYGPGDNKLIYLKKLTIQNNRYNGSWKSLEPLENEVIRPDDRGLAGVGVPA